MTHNFADVLLCFRFRFYIGSVLAARFTYLFLNDLLSRNRLLLKRNGLDYTCLRDRVKGIPGAILDQFGTNFLLPTSFKSDTLKKRPKAGMLAPFCSPRQLAFKKKQAMKRQNTTLDPDGII